MHYEARTFSIPTLAGISERTIAEHLGLYQGYVKHVNRIHDEIDTIADPYAKAEMQRRLGFEFGGMKNHEYYFTQFEGGARTLPEGALKTKIDRQFGSLENLIAELKEVATTRGVGWVMCYFDETVDRIVITWVDEQHLGQLPGLQVVLGLDMWEHSYMLDYPPSEKKKYVDAFFDNLNWEVIANRVS